MSTHINKVSAQPTNRDLTQLKYSRWLFAIRLSKSLNILTLLINIDETNINYETKTNYSWTNRGRLREFKTKPFSGSINMIFAILSNSSWFWTLKQDTTDGYVFQKFWMLLMSWLEKNKFFGYLNTIVLLDNCSSHRNARVKRIMRKSKVEVWYLPPYSYMLAPIKNVF